ncbi:MAG: FAD-binding oxidoreductase [Thermoprotei archaeon]
MSETVIVGGGAVGVSTAYNLALKGVKVTVVEKGYLGCGSSTRNAGGFRVHFKSPENVRYMTEGRRRLLSLGRRLGVNVLPLETGYLWLLSGEDEVAQFRSLNSVWSSLGVAGKFIGVDGAKEMLPDVKLDETTEAFLGPQDGTFHHDFVIQGYERKLRELGVTVLENTEVTGIQVSSGKISGVEAGSKVIPAQRVAVCAGAWTPKVTALAGVNVPITPERRELGVTEPFKYMFKPFVISQHHGVYFAQGIRGDLRGTVTDYKTTGYVPLVSTEAWTRMFAQRICRLVPALRGVGLNRQWSGYYEITPDHSQIMGEDEQWPEGLSVCAGFSGHGMMMSPLTGELMAEYLADGRVSPLMGPYSPERFRKGKLLDELMVI